MSSESDDSKICEDCEIFIAETASLERFVNGKCEKSHEDKAPLSIVYCAGSPVDRAQSLEELRVHVQELEKIDRKKKKYQGFFMGFLTKRQAEKQVSRRGQFATYYHLSDTFETDGIPNESNVSLQLMVVYLDTHYQFRHYPIQKITSPSSSKIFFQLGHSDVQKTSSEPIFFTIKNLLKHYTQFGYVDSFTPSGGIRFEIFPK